MIDATQSTILVVTPIGLEPLAAAEIRAIAPRDAKIRLIRGGVELAADDALLLLLNRHLRTATRVLLRIADFRASAFSELHKRAGRVAWERVLRPGEPVVIRATAHRSRLYHTGGIAERVLRGITERLGGASPLHPERELGLEGAPSDAPPPQLIVVRIVDDLCTISVDTSGDPLHFRGYRLATAKAPLRPTLAAGLLLAAEWDPREPLLDPMCGAGTIAIEAALLAAGRPSVAADRPLACERWPTPPAPSRLTISPKDHLTDPAGPTIFARDHNPGAIKASAANLARAGVEARISLALGEAAALTPPAPTGLILTNPPYGLRVGGGRDGARKAFAALGAALRQRFCGPGLDWRVALLAPDPALAAATGLTLAPRLTLQHGGLTLQLYAGQLRG
jgi:putative N6-adenine-specific DNA methylase